MRFKATAGNWTSRSQQKNFPSGVWFGGSLGLRWINGWGFGGNLELKTGKQNIIRQNSGQKFVTVLKAHFWYFFRFLLIIFCSLLNTRFFHRKKSDFSNVNFLVFCHHFICAQITNWVFLKYYILFCIQVSFPRRIVTYAIHPPNEDIFFLSLI